MPRYAYASCRNTRTPYATSVVWRLQVRVIERDDRLGRILGGPVDRARLTIPGAELHLHRIDAVGIMAAVGGHRVSAAVPAVFAGSAQRHVVGGVDLESVGFKLPEHAIAAGYGRYACTLQQTLDRMTVLCASHQHRRVLLLAMHIDQQAGRIFAADLVDEAADRQVIGVVVGPRRGTIQPDFRRTIRIGESA